MKMILLLLLTLAGGMQALQGQESPAALLIRDVTVVDVARGKLLPGRDLRIEGDRIVRISRAGKGKVEPGDVVIEAAGKYLIPGLVDGHIHLFQSGGLYTRPDAIDLRSYVPYALEQAWLQSHSSDLLKRYLRCGITTVIDVGGPMKNYDLRDAISPTDAAPNLLITGPLISTYQPEAFDLPDPPIVRVESAEEARALVQKQLPHHPDFIKIWYIDYPRGSAATNYPIIAAAVEESHAHGLRVAIHATELATAKLALKAGADYFVHSVMKEPIDEEFIRLAKRQGIFLNPTLWVSFGYEMVFSQHYDFLTAEDLRLADPRITSTLFDLRQLPDRALVEQTRQSGERALLRSIIEDSIRKDNLMRLVEAGIPIVTGTDAGNIGTLHASSYYTEIAFMQDAGMSPAQILEASTLNGARVLGREADYGSVEEGKVADLVLLGANPLEDILALKQVEYVVRAGQLIAPDTLLPQSAEDVVLRQLNAYNAGNVEAFLETYHPEVKFYLFPDSLTSTGIENIAPQYEAFFKANPNLHAEIIGHMAIGNKVIEKEHITGLANGGSLDAIAIYEVESGKIVKVYFVLPSSESGNSSD